MERVNDIKQLLKYNATGNHWITLTKKERGVTQSEVEHESKKLDLLSNIHNMDQDEKLGFIKDVHKKLD
jgi:hypothetical protein